MVGDLLQAIREISVTQIWDQAKPISVLHGILSIYHWAPNTCWNLMRDSIVAQTSKRLYVGAICVDLHTARVTRCMLWACSVFILYIFYGLKLKHHHNWISYRASFIFTVYFGQKITHMLDNTRYTVHTYTQIHFYLRIHKKITWWTMFLGVIFYFEKVTVWPPPFFLQRHTPENKTSSLPELKTIPSS